MTLAQAVERFETRLLAYCVLPKHWHLVLIPRKDGDLSTMMASASNAEPLQACPVMENHPVLRRHYSTIGIGDVLVEHATAEESKVDHQLTPDLMADRILKLFVKHPVTV